MHKALCLYIMQQLIELVNIAANTRFSPYYLCLKDG